MSSGSDVEASPLYPGAARCWRIRGQRLTFSRRPLLMGIVNVTPDSFSDGGRFVDAERAVEHAMRLVSEGADILDIGGESTRPYATPVSAAEELDRVIPVIDQICRVTSIPVSIDTSKPIVAERAIAAGASIINDITGLSGDPTMLDLARETDVGLCAMHMQGTPATMQDNPVYHDVVPEISAYLADRRDALLQAGIGLDRICLDPGIGFGKRQEHNLKLLANCFRFHALGCPLLLGPSRKGFIGKVLGDNNADRVLGTVGTALSLARQGVQVLRVHDVGPVRQALLLFEATGGLDRWQ